MGTLCTLNLALNVMTLRIILIYVDIVFFGESLPERFAKLLKKVRLLLAILLIKGYITGPKV